MSSVRWNSFSASRRMWAMSSERMSRSSRCTRLSSRCRRAGGALARGLRAHLVPGAGEEAHVALEVLLAVAGAHRARDEPAPSALLAQVLEDPLQPAALVVVHDLPRDADVLDGGHEDEIAAGQRDVGGDARPLLPQRLLDHLHEHFLARLEHLLDGHRPMVVGGRRRGGGPAVAAGRRVRPLGTALALAGAAGRPASSGVRRFSSSSSITSATYRNASRSCPMSTKEDCIPGRTRVTFPL